MIRSHLSRALRHAILFAAVLALLPAAAHAQTGRVVGIVVDQAGAAVRGAQVVIAGTRMGGLTNDQGRFALQGVPAGTHQLQVSHVGFKGAPATEVVVREGEETTVEIRLESAPVQLGGLVVSASRKAQRITDAPATITKIGARVLENSVGNSYAGALKEVKGLDFVQVGVTSVAVNARGFNSSFNNRMLMIEDGRVAVLPENGLPVGQFTAVPKVDLEGIEVLVGPGAALYGADASNGVITMTSKDPRRYPGTTVEVTGGNRSYKDVQARHAGVVGNFGYKVAGEWQDAQDWENYLVYAGGVPEVGIDWNSNVIRGTGALHYYQGDNELKVSAGASQSNGVGQTNIGRNQLVDWGYNFLQAQYTTPSLYFNVYRSQSQSGDSYAINRYSTAVFMDSILGTGKSPEQLRLASDWPSNGRMYAAEAQHNFTLPALLNTSVIWGGQYRRDVVSSDQEWLTDRFTGEDIEIGQIGVYAQTETPVAPWMDVVLAARYDRHENYDPQVSPKVALVVKPGENQAVRLTYNRAFKSPTILATNFYAPDFAVHPVLGPLGLFGNTGGYTVKKADGTVLAEYAALAPEENQTWELGYKGVIANRLYVDVTGYRSRYDNFISPLQLVNAPGLGMFAHDHEGKLVTNQEGAAQAALIYFNLGEAELRGVDLGVNYFVTPKVTLKGTYSYVDLTSIEKVDIKNFVGQPDTAKITELSSLNSPNSKWTLGAALDDLGDMFGGVTLRHVDEYFFASGINKGTIPSFTTLDLNVGYRLPAYNTTLNVGVSNLFTCQTAAVEGQADGCGFGQKHQEMINMPEIGTMVFVGMRYHMP